MADGRNSPGPSRRPYGMPLSPHLQIYRWPITMVASIAHRLTGLALASGTLILTWWLVAAATGPDAYDFFVSHAVSPLGRFFLFGFVWSLFFHLLNGVRHLVWDVGYGFKVPTARITAAICIGLSLLMTLAVFTLAYWEAGDL
jgi:succinate dehydrogenase / fumarate reductase cytochrome b subunit